MLLKENSSKVKYYADINLLFEDDTVKRLVIVEDNHQKIKVRYRKDGDIREEIGIVKKLEPIVINTTIEGNCAYGCSCNCSKYRTGILVLDVSQNYESVVRHILLGDILDIEEIKPENIDIYATSSTLQEVLLAAPDGATIGLKPGIYNGEFVIDKSVKLIGDKGVIFYGSIITQGDNIKNISIEDTTFIYNGVPKYCIIDLNTTTEVCLKNNRFYVEEKCRTPIRVESYDINISGNMFICKDSLVYNWIEVCLKKEAKNIIFNDNIFIGNISHNQFSMYKFVDMSNVSIKRNIFGYSGNAIRVSNVNSSTVYFDIQDNVYESTDETDDYKYAGLIFFQDYSKDIEVMDFTKMTVYFKNNKGPNDVILMKNEPNTINQVYYVYDDQRGILTDRNQPHVRFE